jgi:hypothetical protein
MAVRHDRHVACLSKLMKDAWVKMAKEAVVHPGIFLKRLKSIRKFFGNSGTSEYVARAFPTRLHYTVVVYF